MLAIIRKGNGEYYTSLVFGYYSVKSSTEDDYQRYLDSIYNRLYIVLDESKTKLIKQVVFDRKNKYLCPLILVVDHSTEDWNIDENNNGCVSYLDYATKNPPFSRWIFFYSKCSKPLYLCGFSGFF